MRTLRVLFVVGATLLSACGGAAQPSPTVASSRAPAEIDGASAKRLVKEGARLVDVRTPEEFAEKHIEGAENVPVDQIESRDMGPKDRTVIVYCHTGARAAQAAKVLRAKGYTVESLGAMSRWDQ